MGLVHIILNEVTELKEKINILPYMRNLANDICIYVNMCVCTE